MTMMRTHFLARVLAVAVIAAATVSCGSVVRDSASPVFLGIDSLAGASGGGRGANAFSGTLFSDVVVLLTTPAPCSPATPCPTYFADSGQATLRVAMKNTVTTTAPTTNNDVIITGYSVAYHRADGRNTPGVDVPYGFSGGLTFTVSANSTAQISFELVRHDAKLESPLVQLASNSSIVATIADVTFYGADRVGNAVSATGSISIEFGNFGDN
jgi:hypothetical protein